MDVHRANDCHTPDSSVNGDGSVSGKFVCFFKISFLLASMWFFFFFPLNITCLCCSKV